MSRKLSTCQGRPTQEHFALETSDDMSPHVWADWWHENLMGYIWGPNIGGRPTQNLYLNSNCYHVALGSVIVNMYESATLRQYRGWQYKYLTTSKVG